MARRFRQLVPQLWQRELGIRRTRPDAPAHRQHQRPADQGERAQVSLAARATPRRSPIAQRPRPLRGSPHGSTGNRTTRHLLASGQWVEIDLRRGAQMRWKTSVPRTLTTRPFGPTYVAIHRVTTVVGLTNRPCPTVVTLQSAVQFRE